MSPTFRRSFAERNLVLIAVVGLLVLAAVFMVTFKSSSIPIVGGTAYTAHFTEAGGLKEGNEVRIAGVKVGEVTNISLDGTTVVVKFRAKGARLGDQSTAAVKVKTLLGQKFLAIDPLGRERLEGAIPLSRTTTPYDVNAAFSDLSVTVDEIDTGQLEASFEALSEAFADTPAEVRGMLEGLTALSRTVSSRDEEIASLLDSTEEISATLAARNTEFAGIISDGSKLMGELERRRDAIQNLLEGSARLGTELQGLVADNEATLRPALEKLDEVSRILTENQANLDASLKAIGPYYRMVTSTMGNGRWVDSYICGLFDANNAPILVADAERNCQPTRGGGQ